MRKILILLTAILLPLFAVHISADEPVNMKIPLKQSTSTGKITRGLSLESIEAYYYGMLSAVYTSVAADLGEIDITVTNCSTGESWEDTFDSSSISQHLLPISSTPGLYEVTYTTSSGDLYEGTFVIE